MCFIENRKLFIDNQNGFKPKRVLNLQTTKRWSLIVEKVDKNDHKIDLSTTFDTFDFTRITF